MLKVQAASLTVLGLVYLALLLSEFRLPLVGHVLTDRLGWLKLRTVRNYVMCLLPYALVLLVVMPVSISDSLSDRDRLIAVAQESYEVRADMLEPASRGLTFGASRRDQVVWVDHSIDNAPSWICSLQPMEDGVQFVMNEDLVGRIMVDVNGEFYRSVPLEEGDIISTGSRGAVGAPGPSSVEGTDQVCRERFTFHSGTVFRGDVLEDSEGHAIVLGLSPHTLPVLGWHLPVGRPPLATTRVYQLPCDQAGHAGLAGFVFYRDMPWQGRAPYLMMLGDNLSVNDGNKGWVERPTYAGPVSLGIYRVVSEEPGGTAGGAIALSRLASFPSISYQQGVFRVPLTKGETEATRIVSIRLENPGSGESPGDQVLWVGAQKAVAAEQFVYLPGHSEFFDSSQGFLSFDMSRLLHASPDQRNSVEFRAYNGEKSILARMGQPFTITNSPYRIRYVVDEIRWPMRLVWGGLLGFIAAGIIGHRAFQDRRFAILLSSSMFLASFRLLFSAQNALQEPFDSKDFVVSLLFWLTWPATMVLAWYAIRVVALKLHRLKADQSAKDFARINLLGGAFSALFVVLVTLCLKRESNLLFRLTGGSGGIEMMAFGVALPMLLLALLLCGFLTSRPLLGTALNQPLSRLECLSTRWHFRWATEDEASVIWSGVFMLLLRAALLLLGFKESIRISGVRIGIEVIHLPLAAVLFGRACAILLPRLGEGSPARYWRAILVLAAFIGLAYVVPAILVTDLGLLTYGLGPAMVLLMVWVWAYEFPRTVGMTRVLWHRFVPAGVLVMAAGSLFLCAAVMVRLWGSPDELATQDYAVQRMIEWFRPGTLSGAATSEGFSTEEHLDRMVHHSFANGLAGAGYMAPVPSRLYQPDYAEGVASIYLLPQFGLPGAGLVLLAFLSLMLLPVGSQGEPLYQRQLLFSDFAVMTLGATFLIGAIFILAANTGLVPLTGKNIPYLAFTSASDLSCGVAAWLTMLFACLLPRGDREFEPDQEGNRPTSN